MKQLINKLAGAAYRRVFNREMSAAEGDFVQSLSLVGAGTFTATGLIAAFSVLGGRLLGPEEYGKFTLVQSIAMFLYVPMLMGFNTAMLKYNAEEDEPQRQRTIISTAYIIIGGVTVVSAGLMFLFYQPLAGLFAATPELFRFAIYFALVFALFTLAQTTLRSVNRMRAFALSQPIHAAIMLVAFMCFILAGRLSFEGMVYSKLIAFAVTGLGIHLRYARRYFSFSLDRTWARTLSRFAFATLIAITAAAFYGSIGVIIIARYMTVADVGIYGAYLIATMSIAGILWNVFNMVFFPTASKYQDKRSLLRRINRLVPLVIVLGIPLVMGTGYLLLRLYGGDYPFNVVWLAIIATAAVLSIARGFYATLLTSQGPGGAFLSSIAAVATAVVMIVLSLALVPVIGIPGAMVAASAGELVGIAVRLLKGRGYLEPS